MGSLQRSPRSPSLIKGFLLLMKGEGRAGKGGKGKKKKGKGGEGMPPHRQLLDPPMLHVVSLLLLRDFGTLFH